MKEKSLTLILSSLLAIVFFAFAAVGCSGNGQGFQVSGQENTNCLQECNVSSVSDIKNLVTDDDKLVINYYDAYIWVVYFSQTGEIEEMMYIYEFENSEDAESAITSRVSELEQISTMIILDSHTIENYITITLKDTSFTGVTRNMLEYNFNGLII